MPAGPRRHARMPYDSQRSNGDQPPRRRIWRRSTICLPRNCGRTWPTSTALVHHVGRFRGKMLRPMLRVAIGPGGAGTRRAGASRVRAVSPPHVTLATVVEMVHMATLVHDDILDGAEVRRRGATINHLHGNEAAVLLGDFLISHAYHLCSSLGEAAGRPGAMPRFIAHTTNVVCEGELTQNANRRNWKLSEQTYFDIIYRKTAILTETCCRLGAMARHAATPRYRRPRRLRPKGRPRVSDRR